MTTTDTSFYFEPEQLCSNTRFYLEMSQGAGEKMYTLWRSPNPSSKDYDPRMRQTYIKNLSIDRETAWEKAKEYAKRVQLPLEDISLDELRKIIRPSDLEKGMINFGKHEGKYLQDLDDNYLTWIAEGARIEVEELGYKRDVYFALEITVKLAKEEAVKRGLYVEYDGKVISKRYAEYLEKEKKGWGFHFTDKSKVDLILKLTKTAYFDGYYGTTWIYTFEDLNGNKFQYMGSNPPYLFKDLFVRLKATVKTDTYRDREITYLQRIKLITIDFDKWVNEYDSKNPDNKCNSLELEFLYQEYVKSTLTQ